MSTVTLDEAQAHLPQLIENLREGEEIVITRDQKPVARLAAAIAPPLRPRRSGALKGTVLYMAEDFNAPVEDFKEYME